MERKTVFASSSKYFRVFLHSIDPMAMLAPLCKNKNEPFLDYVAVANWPLFCTVNQLWYNRWASFGSSAWNSQINASFIFFSFIFFSISCVLFKLFWMAWQVGKTHRNNNIKYSFNFKLMMISMKTLVFDGWFWLIFRSGYSNTWTKQKKRIQSFTSGRPNKNLEVWIHRLQMYWVRMKRLLIWI